MRNVAAPWALFPTFAAILVCSAGRNSLGQEAVSSISNLYTSPPVSSTSTSNISSTSGTYGSSATSASTTSSAAGASEQVGTGLFSRLPFKLSLSLRVGYDDNVGTSSAVGKQGSGYTTASLGFTYEFGSPRTQLSLGLGVGGTYFWENVNSVGVNANDYDTSNYLSLSIVHKATPRLTLDASTFLTYQSEPNFSFSQGVNRRSGNYFYTSDKFAANYLWTPRFSTNTSYTLDAISYDDDAVGQFENRFENTFGNQFRFVIWPTTTLVVDYRVQIVNYTEATGRDSTSQFALAGVDQVFSPRLSGSVLAGIQFRDSDELGTETSPYFEGSLTYAFSKKTSLAWTGRYSIEQADVASNQSRKTFRTGLTGKYDFTARISGSIGAYYNHDEYQAVALPPVIIPGFTEDNFDVQLSLRYSVTRYLGVDVGYGYTDVSSDVSVREYTRNRFWSGLDLTF